MQVWSHHVLQSETVSWGETNKMNIQNKVLCQHKLMDSLTVEGKKMHLRGWRGGAVVSTCCARTGPGVDFPEPTYKPDAVGWGSTMPALHGTGGMGKGSFWTIEGWPGEVRRVGVDAQTLEICTTPTSLFPLFTKINPPIKCTPMFLFLSSLCF